VTVTGEPRCILGVVAVAEHVYIFCELCVSVVCRNVICGCCCCYSPLLLRRVVTKCLHDADVSADFHIQATEFVFMDGEVTGKKQVSRLCVAVGGYVAADHTSGTRLPSIYWRGILQPPIITDILSSSQSLKLPPEPNSVTTRMEAIRSSETSDKTNYTTRPKPPK